MIKCSHRFWTNLITNLSPPAPTSPPPRPPAFLRLPTDYANVSCRALYIFALQSICGFRQYSLCEWVEKLLFFTAVMFSVDDCRSNTLFGFCWMRATNADAYLLHVAQAKRMLDSNFPRFPSVERIATLKTYSVLNTVLIVAFSACWFFSAKSALKSC